MSEKDLEDLLYSINDAKKRKIEKQTKNIDIQCPPPCTSPCTSPCPSSYQISPYFPPYFPPYFQQQNYDLQTEIITLREKVKNLEEKNKIYKEEISYINKKIDPDNIVYILKKFYTNPTMVVRYLDTIELNMLLGFYLNKIRLLKISGIESADIKTSKLNECYRRLDTIKDELSTRF